MVREIGRLRDDRTCAGRQKVDTWRHGVCEKREVVGQRRSTGRLEAGRKTRDGREDRSALPLERGGGHKIHCRSQDFLLWRERENFTYPSVDLIYFC
jgi:hypothetical protein